MPDPIFDHPRLARVYDALEGDRSDLDAYVDLVRDDGARRVLDVGCGTGTFACRVAADGIAVVGVDPAAASVAVARGKPGGDAVTWIVGTVPDVAVDASYRAWFDLATMTANVAQVFVEDVDWLTTLRAVHRCLRPGGLLAFETRKPADRAWERWTKERSHQVVDTAEDGAVEDWVEVTSVDGALVTFESPTVFRADGERIESTSTLRFRDEDELCATLVAAGFVDLDLGDLPRAPERGWLVRARSAPRPGA
ncbi:class I SAM-dependent methyltransferase [Nocardioides zeae]|uniref:SAM-dependent methyltransferase n=1 Tax=Nocardioides zeae TaxID=1457234 RepID=A0AAJ1U6J9_9ACTN|nr:class I SAM-dependent methyltransferase [Nocardioides zeae]MDQ1105062.1 SAM-dependent methyltransferase [Nocardioides zeae]